MTGMKEQAKGKVFSDRIYIASCDVPQEDNTR